MSGESLDVKIARIDERVASVRDELALARDGRKQQYEMIEKINQTLIKLDGRVSGVEHSLAANAPTIQEFVDIKMKVQGAGLAGKWAWAIGASIVTFLFSIRETIISWMAK